MYVQRTVLLQLGPYVTRKDWNAPVHLCSITRILLHDLGIAHVQSMPLAQWLVKITIRLGWCAGWSDFSLVTYVHRYVAVVNKQELRDWLKEVNLLHLLILILCHLTLVKWSESNYNFLIINCFIIPRVWRLWLLYIPFQ